MEKKYDVSIIGAGISGLICGSLLAKRGLKVAIFEQHYQPGGYCSSFLRDGFRFDVSVLQDCDRADRFGSILDSLGVYDKMNIARRNPSFILMNDHEQLSIYNDFSVTIDELKKRYKTEKNGIEQFFVYLTKEPFLSLYQKRSEKLKVHIDRCLNDINLKRIIYLMFSQIGISPDRASILTASMYFRNLILRGGYHAEGGLSDFIDTIVNKFRKFGGELFLSSCVERLIVQNSVIKGVELNGQVQIESDFVVSACDATQTYQKLMGTSELDGNRKQVSLMKKLRPSISVFTVYLGIKDALADLLPRCSGIWYSLCSGIENPWDTRRLLNDFKGNIFVYFNSFLRESSTKRSCDISASLDVLVPYVNSEFWEKNKSVITSNVLKSAENLFGKIRIEKCIKAIATPLTYEKFTLNRNGAMRGWAPIISGIKKLSVPQISEITNLILAGHWVTTPAGEAGLPMAAYTGETAAKIILREYKKCQ